MKRRWSPTSALIVLALLATCLLLVAPSALAASSPTPAAGNLPKVTYTVPSAASASTAVTAWSGNSVLVN